MLKTTQDKIDKIFDENPFLFVGTMWLLSRLVILTSMMLIAPFFPAPRHGIVPTPGWEVFSGWDSAWYYTIVTEGYSYVDDGLPHSVAFFPLFPLLIKAAISLGLPLKIAAPLINNIAFFGAMWLVYSWVEKLYGKPASRWIIAVMAWSPFSLFGTVAYTEGLFLLFSTATLWAFQKQQYLWVVVCGALATASRPPGMVLIPTLLIVAWQERRSLIAYIASLLTGVGVLTYSLFCWINFGDPFAFIRAQKGWQPDEGTFHGWDWIKLVLKAATGQRTLNYNWLQDPWYPLLFGLICLGCYWLWQSRSQLGEVKTQYGVVFLGFLLWLRGGTPMLNAVLFFGGTYLLWHLRSHLKFILVVYGFCSVGLILSGGVAMSPGRLIYGIVSVIIALGLLLARYPRIGYPTLVFFAYLLSRLAMKFSQHLWAG